MPAIPTTPNAGPSRAPATEAIPHIGVVGVGHMGLAIALRLAEQGHAVTVHDLLPEREALAAAGGCAVAANAAAVAAACTLLLVVVVDAAQTRQVLWGAAGADPAAALSRLRPGCAVMLCPTIAPADVEDIAQRLVARGIEVLDAPMSGGPLRARAGRMSLMVAAADAVFGRWLPVMAQMADPVFHVGRRPGDGARTKLVNNLLAAVNLAGASEAMALAERLGLDAATTLAVIERSSGQSWIGSDRLRRALAGPADRPVDARAAGPAAMQAPVQAPVLVPVHAHLALLAKDSALALAEARACGARVDVGGAAAALFAAARAQGLERHDDSVLLPWLAGRVPTGDSGDPGPPPVPGEGRTAERLP